MVVYFRCYALCNQQLMYCIFFFIFFKQSEGEWYSLNLQTPTELTKTHHKLQLDAHFKLPKSKSF